DLRSCAVDRPSGSGPGIGKRVVVGIGGLGDDHNGFTGLGDNLGGFGGTGRHWRTIGRRRGTTAAEPENNTRVVAEIALVLLSLGKGVTEPGEHKIKLRGPDGEVSVHRNVEASPNDKIPGIVARVVRGGAGGLASLKQVLIRIGMGAAKQRLKERLEVRRTELENGSHVIGKKVALGFHSAACRARTIRSC